MKKLLFILTPVLLSLSGCLNPKITQIKSEIETICKDAVPDKRIDICDCKVEKGDGNTIIIKGEILNPAIKEKILAAAGNLHPGIVDSIILLPENSVADKSWGLVTISVANLKTKPSHASEMATQAIMGTPVRVLKKENGWLYVQTPDHYLSWVTGSSLIRLDQAGLENWRNSQRVIFSENYGAVTDDITGSKIVSDLVAGSLLLKTGEAGDYNTVMLPDGRSGYVSKEQCADFDAWRDSDNLNGENLVKTAEKFMALPYLWGGTSSKAVDCSGFMKNVWFLHGIILERDASQQYRHGEAIATDKTLSDLQPGDLLFFGRKDPERITHTGMCIGNGEVIHSSTSNGRVKINSLDSTRSDFSRILYDSFVGVKRYLGQPPQFGYMPVKDHPWY